jgi:hypothetical protein
MTNEILQTLAERTYFFLCSALGRLLRAARYSSVRVVSADGRLQVRKSRRFYAPLLVFLGGPLVRLLDTGVRVLPQREWHARERRVYWMTSGTPIRSDSDGTLVLPWHPGKTLAALLEDSALGDSIRARAIARAAAALAEFHQTGLTHGDAMADNVLIDLEGGGVRWFDFETVHDPGRPLTWRRADDVRALLVTCAIRVRPEARAEVVQLILDTYGSDEITAVLVPQFTSAWHRPLAFHLGQARLSFQCFREIAALLRARHAYPGQSRLAGTVPASGDNPR